MQHHQAGRLSEAEQHYRGVLESEPEHPGALHLLGVVALQVGAHQIAADLIGKAVALQPDFAEAHSNLGNALRELGQLDDAIATYRTAVTLKPNFAAALGNLGNTLRQAGQTGEAIAIHRQAVALEPRSADALNNLGNALRDHGVLDEAAAAIRKAIALRPQFALAYSNLGNVLKDQFEFDEAVTAYRTALELDPQSAEIHNNLGSALNDLGKFEEAITHHDRSLQLRPDYADAHLNRALPVLSMGRLAEGWAEYEWRLRMSGVRPPPVAVPVWDGGALDGRSILVSAEQGIGDEILFASCLPDLIARGGRCIIECEPRLGDLFARSFPTATVFGRQRGDESWLAEAPPIDTYVKFGSLMHHFRPDLESFPDRDGYLRADPKARTSFADRLAALGPGLKVGISWRSMLDSHWGPSYSALDDWHDILRIDGTRFVNLQYDRSEPEVAEVNRRPGIEIHEFDGLDLLNDFEGVAALIAELDLVIAPTNTVSDLAGALGTPVWFLDLDPNWALFGAEGHPWFPRAKVYRRTRDMSKWHPVLKRVARDLGQRIKIDGGSP